jgi:serine/threonine-protein kinase
MAATDIETEPEEPAPSPVRRGRQLGRYVLCYELASGGMATVYLARADGQRGFGKMAALKIIHPHLAKQKDFVEMFLDEARIAARIVHPNVCSVFDFGEEDGTYYLAMDYLVGENAGRVMRALVKHTELKESPQTPLLLARIVADACEGMHAAHEVRGDDGQLLHLVHRDVTPQNIFVGYDGSVRVVDFGVATAVGRSHQTSAGTLKGKFAYMSPEQAMQQPLDRRSDVWGLGVCLWEVLTRRRLFARDTEYQTLKAVAENEVPPPSKYGGPPAFDDVVMRALSRDREKRQATARELGRGINAAIAQLGSVGAGDLAEMMDALFADARAERNALIERARKVDPEQPSTSKISPAPAGGFYDRSISSPGTVTATKAAPAPPGPRRVPLIAGAIGACALVALVAVGAWLAWPGDPVAPAPVAAGPTTVPVAPDDPTPSPIVPPDPGEVAIAGAGAPPDPATPEATGGTATPERTPRGERSSDRRERREREREEREERESGRAEAGGTGTVNVVTPPGWAEIFVDGRRVGRSPTEVRMPAGRRSIRLMPYGEGPAIERSIEVEPGGVSRLVVRLEAPPE